MSALRWLYGTVNLLFHAVYGKSQIELKHEQTIAQTDTRQVIRARNTSKRLVKDDT